MDQLPNTVKTAFARRRDIALEPMPFAANLMDHRCRGIHLTEAQKSQAYEFLKDIDRDFVPLVLCHSSASQPFPSHMYGEEFRCVCPITWWKSVTLNSFNWSTKKEKWLKLCEQLFSAVATTAAVERVISSFALVQSKLRNKLRNEKAAKLTFMYKYMNQQQQPIKKSSLDFIWNEEAEAEEKEADDDDDDDQAVPEADCCGDLLTCMAINVNYERSGSERTIFEFCPWSWNDGNEFVT